MAANRAALKRAAERAEIARLALQDVSIRDIAQILGLSTSTVQADLRFLRRRWMATAPVDAALERAQLYRGPGVGARSRLGARLTPLAIRNWSGGQAVARAGAFAGSLSGAFPDAH